MSSTNVLAPSFAQGVDVVAYLPLADRPAFKMALKKHEGRYFLYAGHLWHRGWTVVDVTTPHEPQVLEFIPGPANTWTGQIDVAGDLMLTGLERIPPGWDGDDEDVGHGSGFSLWSLADPAVPSHLSDYLLEGRGTHRNLIEDNGLAHLAAHTGRFAGRHYQQVDCADPSKPVLTGEFHVIEQETTHRDRLSTSLHGPPVPSGEYVFLPYGGIGMVVITRFPADGQFTEVSRLSFSPPFLEHIGVHSAMPLPERDLVVVCSEATQEDCQGGLGHISVVDVSDIEAPALLSIMPVPHPTDGEGLDNYCNKGGRFGPHNIHLHRHNTGGSRDDRLVYATYFNAGLRVYDISDPILPREVAAFVPDDPAVRYGPQPAGRLVAQSEDVIVDDRGHIFVSHKNQGIWCLALTDRPD
jgi:hypothetical protein